MIYDLLTYFSVVFTGDKQEELMTLRRDLEMKLQQQKEEYTDTINKLNLDLISQNNNLQAITAEKIRLTEELTRKLSDYEDKMGKEVGGQAKELRTLQNNLNDRNEELKIIRARIVEREEECDRVQRLLREKSEVISEYERSSVAQQGDIERLKVDLRKSTQSGEGEGEGTMGCVCCVCCVCCVPWVVCAVCAVCHGLCVLCVLCVLCAMGCVCCVRLAVCDGLCARCVPCLPFDTQCDCLYLLLTL